MKIKRRDFIKQSAVTLGGVVMGGNFAKAANANASINTGTSTTPTPLKHDPFEIVRLGKTDLKMPRLCLGTGVHGGQRASNQTRMGKEKFEALIHASYERGVRVFDMADLYGTHPYLLPALKTIPRKDYVIISKIWWREGGIPEKERPDADVVIPRFLKELGTDYLDLVLLHCVTSGKWPEELQKQMNILAGFKKKGVIRAHGVSCHSLEALEAGVNEPWVDSVHARINPYGMSMDGPAEKVAPVLKRLHAAGKGIVGMKLVGEGRLRDDEDKKDESIRYVLGLNCVDILNVGFEKESEVDDFTARVRKVQRTA